MKFQALFFCLMFTCMYLCLAQGSYSNCCIRYAVSVKKHAYKQMIGYRRQETDGDCNIPAIVFMFKKKRTVCGNPTDNWVQNTMIQLDEKIKKQARAN